MSFVHGGKIVWCLLSRVAKKCGVFCSPWQKPPGVFWVWCLLSYIHKMLITYVNVSFIELSIGEKKNSVIMFLSLILIIVIAIHFVQDPAGVSALRLTQTCNT